MSPTIMKCRRQFSTNSRNPVGFPLQTSPVHQSYSNQYERFQSMVLTSNSKNSLRSWSSLSSLAKVLMLLMMIMVTLFITTTMATTAMDVRDDDCMGIAMRPLPRFGKRSDMPDLNRETVNRMKRSCIINRRQSKSSEPSWMTDGSQEDHSLSAPMIAQQPQSLSSVSSLLRNRPAWWWKRLLEQMAAERDRQIIERIMNRDLMGSRANTIQKWPINQEQKVSSQ